MMDDNVPEVPLQPCVDGEATSSGIHGGHILTVVDLFENLFGSVVPMIVVQMLSYECVWLYCAIRVHFRHIHVVNKVD